MPSSSLAAWHGPLLVAGFFGTVISLERAVALAERWAYGAPLLAGASALLLAIGAPLLAAPLAAAGAALLLLAATLRLQRRQPLFHSRVLSIGAACWLAGQLGWLAGQRPATAVPWWIGFLLLTIAGERLELSRLRPRPRQAEPLFALLVLVLVAGLLLGTLAPRLGWPVLGVASLLLAAWLARYDIAVVTLRQPGLPRFTAACLLSGFAWLAVAGALLLLPGAAAGAGPGYDAAMHAFFLGFVFAMVFGHAPIIFPAVTRLAMPWHWFAWLPLLALHASLLVRLAGDSGWLADGRRCGGALNVLAILLFIAGTLAAVLRGRRAATLSRAATPPGPGPDRR